MKKILSMAALALTSVVMFTACEDDRDSNPTLIQPTSFVLNTPEYSNSTIDLAKSSALGLTWSQPQYTADNAPVNATYEIQMSPTNSWNVTLAQQEADETGATVADYVVFDETTQLCNSTVNVSELAKSLNQILRYEEDAVPATQDLYFRVRSFIKDAAGNEYHSILSNVVKLTAIPYYVELKDADIELWWLIGGDICDGSWGSDFGKCVIPMQPVDGYEYDKKNGTGDITWTGYLAGNGFKLRGDMNDGWATQWGQGDAFGSFVKNDGGSGNITVPAAGYYTITLNTASDKLTIVDAGISPTVFTSMCISGDFNGWGDTEMTPAFTFGGAVNHDWYATVTLDGTQGIKFKESGSWDYNTGGAQNARSDGFWGYGNNNGDNLYPEAGTYTVVYNDITRYYRFIKQ